VKILLLAGEESGLLYANALRARWSAHEVRGYQDEGFATADLAVFGFAAVVRRLFFFLRVARTMRRVIETWRPDLVCTIDYPGLNLRLAAFAHARGIRTVHLVCPQVWAWHQDRIPRIEAALDRLYCFFPFEPKLFPSGIARFVGHPLAADFGAATVARPPRPRPLVALLPGSRCGEIQRILPDLLRAAERMPGVDFVVPAANARARKLIDAQVARARVRASVTVQLGGARAVLRTADCAAVASGTATLEAALAGCPTVLVYRVAPLLAWFARRVIKGTRYIGLANIVWDRCGGKGAQPPMPELLQEAFTPAAVAERLTAYLADRDVRRAAADRLMETVGLLKSAEDPLGVMAREIATLSPAGDPVPKYILPGG
jgi:lipid-A-disaccharide synthase